MFITRKEYEGLYTKIERLLREKKEAINVGEEKVREKNEIIAEYRRLLRNFLKYERKNQNYGSVENVLNKLETEVEKIGGKLWEEHNTVLYWEQC